MAFYQLRTTQKIPGDIESVWNFISRPENLQRITPDHMGFEILTPHLPQVMYPGMIIEYTVRPIANIPLKWVTEITQVRERSYFVDEQRVGPYSMWHHEHWIEPIEGGVLMKDIISYRPPLGILGAIANSLFIGRQLNGIFTYRERALNEIFGEFPA